MSLWRRGASEVRDAVRPWRLILAAKTALAAGLAWIVGGLVPGAVEDYSYYAPLGALVSMMPTIAGSVRTSVQTAVALASGIGLAWLIIVLGGPTPWSVPIAVGVGVLLSGVRALGPGRSYVPITALFVLVVGGTDAESYSLGYIVQMAIGMAVGLAVNLLVAPPLYSRMSAGRISALRVQTASGLRDIGSQLADDRRADDLRWKQHTDALYEELVQADDLAVQARKSRRLNLRSRWNRHDSQKDYDDLQTLRWLRSRVVNVGESLSGDVSRVAPTLGSELRGPLAAVLEASADLVSEWDDERRADSESARSVHTTGTTGSEGTASSVRATRNVENAIRELEEAFSRRPRPATIPDEAIGSVIFDVRRISALVGERLRQGSGSGSGSGSGIGSAGKEDGDEPASSKPVG
ncbi:FUSC family protein [Marisediminicola sp. LYQ85]|uniref:FUSC family protein n=1 Tax=Marisediminicola sp. LYQ85 TaxID=3391062 RepID=UPI0039831F64